MNRNPIAMLRLISTSLLVLLSPSLMRADHKSKIEDRLQTSGLGHGGFNPKSRRGC